MAISTLWYSRMKSLSTLYNSRMISITVMLSWRARLFLDSKEDELTLDHDLCLHFIPVKRHISIEILNLSYHYDDLYHPKFLKWENSLVQNFTGARRPCSITLLITGNDIKGFFELFLMIYISILNTIQQDDI